MRVLLDTHAFLWLVTNDERLSEAAKSAFLDTGNSLFLSIASAWEMAIKVSLGKLTLSQPLEYLLPDQLGENGIGLLDIKLEHVLKLANLTFHHRDPFDRLLVAQAVSEGLPLLSADVAMDAYPITRIW